MWRPLLALLGALVALLVAGSIAYANGGPHGDYGTDITGSGLPSQCGACHRVHQGKSSGKLLKAESQYALCLTCHNGAGSRLDVLDGVRLGAQVTPDAGIDRASDTAKVNVSVAPTALMNVPLEKSVGGAILDDGGVLTVETTDANSVAAGDVSLLPTLGNIGVGDAFYIGSASPFTAARISVGTAGAGTWTVTWEYYNGTTWVALTGVVDGTVGFKTVGTNEVSWSYPTDFRLTTVNSTRLYWVRGRVSAFTSATVAPLGTQLWVGGFPTEFTIAVYNRDASPVAVTLAVQAESNLTDFNSSAIDVTSQNVTNGTVWYTTLRTRAKSAAAAGASNLTTVRVTEGANTADVIVQSKVGDQTAGSVLNGGGFRYVAGVPSTSRHNADPIDQSLYPWGYGTNTSMTGTALTSALQCTSCHNPHGTSNYRLLKNTINTKTVLVKAYTTNEGFVVDEGARGLDGLTLYADKYTKEYYGSAGTGKTDGTNPGAPITTGGSLASLCGACHNAYPSGSASTAYSLGGVTHYRHATEMPFTEWTAHPTGPSGNPPCNPETTKHTDNATLTCDGTGGYTVPVATLRLASNATQTNTIVTCLTCHRVHGTTSTMDNYALRSDLGGLADTDLSPAQSTGSRSVLLYTNNRGMCEACHQW